MKVILKANWTPEVKKPITNKTFPKLMKDKLGLGQKNYEPMSPVIEACVNTEAVERH